jgi:hypothetical protein
VSST